MNTQLSDSIDSWVCAFSNKPNRDSFAAAHFNELGVVLPGVVGGVLELACDIFHKAGVSLEKYGLSDNYVPFVFIPLGKFSQLTLWDSSLLGRLARVKEPPSLYITLPNNMFIHALEEYRVPIALPTKSEELIGLFRCFRTYDEMECGDEFEGAICLFVQR